MKKSSFCVLFVLFSVCAFAQEVIMPVSVSQTTSLGIAFDGAYGSLTALPENTGISGLMLKFLNEKREGIEVPISIRYKSYKFDNSLNGQNDLRSYWSYEIGAGYVFKIFDNQVLRINSIPSIFLSYASDWSQDFIMGVTTDPVKDRVTWYYGIAYKLELEVPIGGIFSLPANTLCLASGIKIRCYYSQTSFQDKSLEWYGEHYYLIDLSTYGTSINALSIRYYF